MNQYFYLRPEKKKKLALETHEVSSVLSQGDGHILSES